MVGFYVCYFILVEGFKNYDVYVVFEGVEWVMYVWLNGYFIGYVEDFFILFEFDLMLYLVDGDNFLVVEVYKYVIFFWIED